MVDYNEQIQFVGCNAASPAVASPETMGFKGYNLWRMDKIGMPVPQAFVLATRFCQEYHRHGRKPPRGLQELLVSCMQHLEHATGLGFGSPRKPLLVSVRSGAPVSMPGMLETVLDIGLCDSTVPGLLRLTGNPRLVWDSYRRLVASFAETVHGISSSDFETALAARLEQAGVASAAELDFQSLRTLTRDYLELYEQRVGSAFPQAPREQLEAAVIAVWASWTSDKATQYRRLNGVSDESGTAVTVQRMIYGNAGGTSGAGVGFTRDPASGEPRLYLDFMFNAQGEDVVSGRRSAADAERLSVALPSVFEEMRGAGQRLEKEFGDMQEFEFTVQDGKVYLLQTRSGKRTPWAALRITVDQVDEGLIDEEVALARLSQLDIDKIEGSRIVTANANHALCRGTPAGMGVAIGEIALDSNRARELAQKGRAAILVRDTAATEDIAGIAASAGILTAAGSRTSHAAVVARQLNKACIVGCSGLTVDLSRRRCALAGQWLNEGDVLSLDSQTGDVFAGPVTVEVEKPNGALMRVAQWRNARERSTPTTING
jgi:pyruvate,orthophosphate dikinase